MINSVKISARQIYWFCCLNLNRCINRPGLVGSLCFLSTLRYSPTKGSKREHRDKEGKKSLSFSFEDNVAAKAFHKLK